MKAPTYSKTYYNNSLIVECFFSLFDKNIITNNDFIWGFWKALSLFNTKLSAKYILIETIGYNIYINDLLNMHTISTTPNAYFLYNYIHPPVSSDKIMIII